MKYMILIHSDMAFWQTLPEAEVSRVLGNHYKVIEESKASGELIRVEATIGRSSSSATERRP